MKQYIPKEAPVAVRPGMPRTFGGTRYWAFFGYVSLYTLVLGPVIRSYCPDVSWLISLIALVVPALWTAERTGRILYVYADRVVEKHRLFPSRTYYYYRVSQIRRCRGGKYHISFGHKRLTVPRSYENTELLLSAMERYFKHKENVVPISLLRILKEIQVSA